MLTQEQLKKYKIGWLKRQEEIETALKQRHELALKKAGEIARILRNKYGIKQVVLFGSTVNGRFWGHSDLDIAVYGMKEEQYLDIAWELFAVALPFKVDLIPIEKASAGLLRKIKEEGEEIKCYVN